MSRHDDQAVYEAAKDLLKEAARAVYNADAPDPEEYQDLLNHIATMTPPNDHEAGQLDKVRRALIDARDEAVRRLKAEKMAAEANVYTEDFTANLRKIDDVWKLQAMIDKETRDANTPSMEGVWKTASRTCAQRASRRLEEVRADAATREAATKTREAEAKAAAHVAQFAAALEDIDDEMHLRRLVHEQKRVVDHRNTEAPLRGAAQTCVNLASGRLDKIKKRDAFAAECDAKCEREDAEQEAREQGEEQDRKTAAWLSAGSSPSTPAGAAAQSKVTSHRADWYQQYYDQKMEVLRAAYTTPTEAETILDGQRRRLRDTAIPPLERATYERVLRDGEALVKGRQQTERAQARPTHPPHRTSKPIAPGSSGSTVRPSPRSAPPGAIRPPEPPRPTAGSAPAPVSAPTSPAVQPDDEQRALTGQDLDAYRQHQGLSQRQLAPHLDTTEGTISKAISAPTKALGPTLQRALRQRLRAR